MAKSLRKIAYEKLTTKEYVGEKALTIEEAKKLIGWRSEKDPNEKEAFGDNYKFRDSEGSKIRLDNCETNRPFRKSLALVYANDILRNKWKYNGERIVFDLRNNCQSGQHRLCGFIMAEQLRKKEPKTWAEYGSKGVLTLECSVIWGISDDNSTVDTLDIGQKRSLGDVIFRNRQFEKYTEREQIQLAQILQGAVRVVWLVMGGQLVTSAPKLMHSVALDLIEDHPKLLDAVAHVFAEDAGTEKQIRNFISLGYAAGLMYVQAACETKTAKYDEEGATALDFKRWDDAEKFWTLLAAGGDDVKKGHPIYTLKTFLSGASASGGHERDEIIAAVKLAWTAYVEEKSLGSVNDLKPGHSTDKKTGKKTLLMPYIGGLDVKREPAPKPPKPAKEVKVKTEGGKGKSKGKGKTKAPKNKKTTSYPFTIGDEVHVAPSGINDDTKKPWEQYKGRVVAIEDNGDVKVMPAGCKADDDVCTLTPKEGDYVGIEAAPEEVS